MNEVEKLYENAGIKSLPTCKNCNMLDEYWSNGTYCSTCKCDKDNYECNIANYIYPPFTAKKQIELIKWLAIRFNSDYMAYWHNEIKDVWIFRLYELTEISSEEPYIYEGRNKDFTEALCDLFNDLWQDLTEEERRQIKDILQ